MPKYFDVIPGNLMLDLVASKVLTPDQRRLSDLSSAPLLSVLTYSLRRCSVIEDVLLTPPRQKRREKGRVEKYTKDIAAQELHRDFLRLARSAASQLFSLHILPQALQLPPDIS